MPVFFLALGIALLTTPGVGLVPAVSALDLNARQQHRISRSIRIQAQAFLQQLLRFVDAPVLQQQPDQCLARGHVQVNVSISRIVTDLHTTISGVAPWRTPTCTIAPRKSGPPSTLRKPG